VRAFVKLAITPSFIRVLSTAANLAVSSAVSLAVTISIVDEKDFLSPYNGKNVANVAGIITAKGVADRIGECTFNQVFVLFLDIEHLSSHLSVLFGIVRFIYVFVQTFSEYPFLYYYPAVPLVSLELHK
jgi:hypothetical protein